jgi:hypothetical protein
MLGRSASMRRNHALIIHISQQTLVDPVIQSKLVTNVIHFDR